MWQLANHTRFAVDRCFARDPRGAEVWLVAVKGTFAIEASGRLDADVAQEPVALGPVYLGAPGRSSLRCDTDLPWTRPGTDVLVVGHACAPHERPATRVRVTLRAGPIDKTLVVVGDRRFRMDAQGLAPSEPAAFVRMPLVYERAFGGDDPVLGAASRDPRNPVGVGFASRPEHLVGAPVPNVERVDAPGTIAGFGAIARDWSPRRDLAGTYDDAWRESRMPLPPLDFDPRYFHAAPEDQRVPDYLREGSPVEVLGMTHDGALRFEVPRVRPCFRTVFGRETVEHRSRLHTVLVDADARRVSVVWHTALPCHGREHRLDRTVIWEKRYV